MYSDPVIYRVDVRLPLNNPSQHFCRVGMISTYPAFNAAEYWSLAYGIGQKQGSRHQCAHKATLTNIANDSQGIRRRKE